ncbi:ribonuclease H-like domain-containing protein [Tanacetum coccineum]
MSSFNHYGCSFCGGPHNGGNCPGCSVIESGNGFVYDQNPYPYHETNDYFNQPPQHQYETYSCEFCGGNSHPGFDCQTGNTPVFDQGPCYNQDFGFNQPPHYSPSQPQQYPCCEICGNDAHYGYDCPPQVPFVYDQDPCYNQDYDEFPQTLPSFQQQILCCENCGGPHATFECQPMNQNFHDSGFDQFQPPQSPVIHQPPQEMSMEALQAREDLMKSIENFLKKFNRISFQKTPKVLMQAWDKFLEIKHAQSEDVQELLNKLVDDVRNVNEELAEYTNTPSWNLPNSSYDDDDDEESSIPLKDIIMSGLPPCDAITHDLPTEEPEYSLSMADKHLDTISETESDKVIKSSVENLVPIPSESEDFSDNESECDMPVCDDFTTFSNPLFDSNDDFTSSDDKSLSNEDVPMENFKIYSNPLFDDEEIISHAKLRSKFAKIIALDVVSSVVILHRHYSYYGFERFNKQETPFVREAVAPVDLRNGSSHMPNKQAKGGDVVVLTLTWATFQRAVLSQFFLEPNKSDLKREYHSIRQRAIDNSTCVHAAFHPPSLTLLSVAEVARNLEILRDWDDYDMAGHLQRDCKKNIGASSSGHADKKPDASGRVFALTQDQAANTSGTITGTLFIFGRAVFVLFDTGATHSVISTKFASCFTMTPILLDHVLCISTPMKDSARITHVYRDLPLQFDDKIRSVNALPLDMCEFDIILHLPYTHGCEGDFWLPSHDTLPDARFSIHDHR